MKSDNFDELNDFVQNNYNHNKLKIVKRKKIIIILINIISITCLIGGGIGLKSIYDYKKDLSENKLLQQKLNDYYKEMEEYQKELAKQEKERLEQEEKEKEEENKRAISPIIDFQPLLNTNPDTIGWLTVRNTNINLPIVQTDNNEYYLTHNFEKNWNSLGWAFADYRNHFPDLDKNTIFYGHTYRDTIVFSTLDWILKDSWLNDESNHIIEFSTLERYLSWEVFSIYTIENTNDYIQTEFNDQQFINFTNMLKERSIKNFNVDINTEDKILTLSTCYIDSSKRLVVHAKLIG